MKTKLILTLLFVVSLLNAQHFVPIWENNGFSHMNVYVVNATIDGEPISDGDEIGVFSNNNCVGTTVYTEGMDLISIITSMNDNLEATPNGFNNGDSIVFKIWDSSEAREADVINVQYYTDLTHWVTDGKFKSLESAFTDVQAKINYNFTVPLKANWSNLVSFGLNLNDRKLTTLLKPLIDNNILIKVSDDRGNTFEKLPDGTWKNDIGNLNLNEGYRIVTTTQSSIDITGYRYTSASIPLTTGWNYVSFPLVKDIDALTIFQPLIENGSLVIVLDGEGQSLEEFTDGWVNNIGNVIPNKGYAIKVSNNVTLNLTF